MAKSYRPEHMRYSEFVGVMLPKADKLILERMAIRRNTTISELVRHAIREVVLDPPSRGSDDLAEHE